jgi:hypothetical protein
MIKSNNTLFIIMVQKNPEQQSVISEETRAVQPEPSPALQSAREKMIRKRMDEGAELTGPQKKFYDEHMKDNESVLDGLVATGEGETMVNSGSETRINLGKEEKPEVKGFIELPEEERRRRYKEMKETEEKEKQEAMAAARAKIEDSYKRENQPVAPSMEELGERLEEGKENMRKEVLREEEERRQERLKKKQERKAEEEAVLDQKVEQVKLKEEELEKDQSPQEAIKSLFELKKETEAKLSKAEDKAEKEELLGKKRELAQKILTEARQIPQFKDIEFEIQREQEKQWEQGIAASGYQSTENYNKWIENIYYDEIIKGSNLSEKQKKEISEHGSIIVSSWPKTIELEKGDVAVALKMGIDINTIRGPRWWNPFSRKVQVGNKVFDNIGKLNEHFLQGKADKINGEIVDRVGIRKREIIEKSSDPIIDDKIQKLMKSLFGPKETPNQEKSVEDRLGLLGRLRGDWNKANEIHVALKDKNWKIKTPDGKLIIGSEAKAKMEQRLGELSEDIIKAAGQIEGRNLKKEALKVTGYKLDKDPQKQKEYRQWLTDEVRKIFEKEKGGIEKATGKKVVAKKKNKAEDKTQTPVAPKPEPDPAKLESEPAQPEISPQPEVIKNRGIEIKKPEVKIETLPGYEIGQIVDIVFPDPKNKGYYISDKGSVFKGVTEENGEKIVMLEKDGSPYSMLLELFLKTQEKKTLAQNPDELIKDLPDFPGLAKKQESPKLKVKKQEDIKGPQFPEGFRSGIKKGAQLKPIIKRGKK